MINHSPIRNQEPEPVRPWVARLFRRRPTLAEIARANLVAADPAGALAVGMRQAEELRNAREEAARCKRHADTYAEERDTAVEAFNAKVLEVDDARRDRDGAYRERAQLLAWLAALHPSTAVITPASDITDEYGWQRLYLVAGGWQMSWYISPRDVDLFQHVTAVEPGDERARWDGHGAEQKYERLRNHVRLLALDELGTDGLSTPVTTEVRSA